MTLSIIEEKTTGYLSMTFTDKDGSPLTPTEVTVEIIDKGSGTALRSEAAETSPASSMEIELSSDENAIVNNANAVETRRVIIRGTYGSSKKINSSYDYQVKNLSKVT